MSLNFVDFISQDGQTLDLSLPATNFKPIAIDEYADLIDFINNSTIEILSLNMQLTEKDDQIDSYLIDILNRASIKGLSIQGFSISDSVADKLIASTSLDRLNISYCTINENKAISLERQYRNRNAEIFNHHIKFPSTLDTLVLFDTTAEMTSKPSADTMQFDKIMLGLSIGIAIACYFGIKYYGLDMSWKVPAALLGLSFFNYGLESGKAFIKNQEIDSSSPEVIVNGAVDPLVDEELPIAHSIS